MANMYNYTGHVGKTTVKDSVTYIMCVRQEVLHVTLAWVKPGSWVYQLAITMSQKKVNPKESNAQKPWPVRRR